MTAAGAVVACALLALHASASLEVKLYNGYKLIRVEPVTREHVEYLQALQEDESFPFKLDFWSEPFLNKPCDINSPPEAMQILLVEFRLKGMKATIIQDDVQALIETTKLKDRVAALLVRAGVSQETAQQTVSDVQADYRWLAEKEEHLLASMPAEEVASFAAASQLNVVGTFPRHAAINTWLASMAAAYPSLASTQSIGKSYESRDMLLIKIGKDTGRAKPIIWLDAAIHAREWLTVGTAIGIINKLLTAYGSDSTVTELVDFYDWYILPVVNPDGYEYTHVSDRLWRKTRSKVSGSTCVGTDPNRNFDFQWRVSGTSTSACSDTYGGPTAFSEKETQNLRDAINGLKSSMKLYMGLHSYSQLWLTPWAYGSAKPVDNVDMMYVATQGEAALRVPYGTRFTVGAPPDILYAASGGTYDWVKAVAGVKYAYTLELRPNSNAVNGFVVNENQIQPSTEEVWAGLARVAKILQTRN